MRIKFTCSFDEMILRTGTVLDVGWLAEEEGFFRISFRDSYNFKISLNLVQVLLEDCPKNQECYKLFEF